MFLYFPNLLRQYNVGCKLITKQCLFLFEVRVELDTTQSLMGASLADRLVEHHDVMILKRGNYPSGGAGIGRAGVCGEGLRLTSTADTSHSLAVLFLIPSTLIGLRLVPTLSRIWLNFKGKQPAELTSY